MANGYYYQTRNGKKVRVKKGLKAQLKRDITAGTRSAAASAGFVLGTGAGAAAANLVHSNPALRVASMSVGAIGGATIANILAERTLYRKNLIDAPHSCS